MSSLAVFEFGGQSIRATGDGRFSVYDVLVAFIPVTKRAGKKGEAINPRQLHKSIAERYPEVVQLSDNFKFPGRGQRETPVATEEGIYQILMLCPGKRGAEFRSWAAKIVRERREEESNPELAYSRGRQRAIKIWRKNGLSDQDIAARIQGIERRHFFCDTLQLHGVEGAGYAMCTNAIYEELFDGTAAELREERNLPAKANVRDSFNMLESSATMFAEAKAADTIKKRNLQGNKECREASQKAGRAVRKVLDED